MSCPKYKCYVIKYQTLALEIREYKDIYNSDSDVIEARILVHSFICQQDIVIKTGYQCSLNMP